MSMSDMTIERPARAAGTHRNYRMLKHSFRVSALLAFLLCVGFLIFAHAVSTAPGSSLRQADGSESETKRTADGIVALTGGEERIAEAVKLLAERRARRLLITGVNPGTTKPELVSLNPRSARLFQCCVDLDKRALDTRDNATETTLWARQQGFRSLIVVTSSYHMPRSLIELRQVMPDVDLIPYPVKAPTLRGEDWWGDRRTLWVLAREYVKLLTALARYAAHQLIEGGAENSNRVVNARMG